MNIEEVTSVDIVQNTVVTVTDTVCHLCAGVWVNGEKNCTLAVLIWQKQSEIIIFSIWSKIDMPSYSPAFVALPW